MVIPSEKLTVDKLVIISFDLVGINLLKNGNLKKKKDILSTTEKPDTSNSSRILDKVKNLIWGNSYLFDPGK